jgi:pimeloyl-ACP methyl ester carboxylesterase
MIGRFVDTLRFTRNTLPQFGEGFFYLDTDFGKIRAFDSGGNRPVIINVPDGPNVIEHHLPLIKELSQSFRVVCFEYPGLGFSFPNRDYDYSFESGSGLLLQVIDILDLSKVSLLFSCSNGYYAIRAAIKNPECFHHIFLSQTPSVAGLFEWAKKSIPGALKVPVIGQLTNAIYAEKLAEIWYKYALPKNHPERIDYSQTARNSLRQGGCFCLSSLVQGLKKEGGTSLSLSGVPTTLVWGSLDFTHRKTDKNSIKSHISDCEIIEFSDCGHFPELEKRKQYVDLIKERVE